MILKMVIATTFLFLQATQPPSPPRYKLTVTDAQGAIISQAHVIIHRQTDMPSHYGVPRTEPIHDPDRTLVVGATGQIDLTMRTGAYNVCVMADAFAPACREFDFYKDSAMTISLEVSKLDSYRLMN